MDRRLNNWPLTVGDFPFRLGSEPDFELRVEAMLARIVCDLSLVCDAEGCVWREVEIEPGLDEAGILGDRHARNVEGIAAGKGMGRDRRGVAKSMPPAERAMHRCLHAAEVEGRGKMDAERGEGGVGGLATNMKRSRAAFFREAIGVQADVGEIGEGLEGYRAHVDAVACLAEGLEGAGGIVR